MACWKKMTVFPLRSRSSLSISTPLHRAKSMTHSDRWRIGAGRRAGARGRRRDGVHGLLQRLAGLGRQRAFENLARLGSGGWRDALGRANGAGSTGSDLSGGVHGRRWSVGGRRCRRGLRRGQRKSHGEGGHDHRKKFRERDVRHGLFWRLSEGKKRAGPVYLKAEAATLPSLTPT
jgi:hypothetical protein